MAEIITATFQDGAFVPDHAIGITAGTRVKLTVEHVEPVDLADESSASDKQQDPAAAPIVALDELCRRHPIYSGLRLTRDQLHERD